MSSMHCSCTQVIQELKATLHGQWFYVADCGAGAAAVRPSAKELSPDLASFRSPMQFGFSRLQQDAQLQNVAPQTQKSIALAPPDGQIANICLPARRGQGAARSATDGWGLRRQSND